jgi:thiol:disulfide interchange protein DsbD
MNKTAINIKLLALLIFIMVIPKGIFGQFEDPVSVSSSTIQEARAGEVVDVVVTVDLDQGWYIYAIEGITEGPVPTKITVAGDSIEKTGVVQEPDPTIKFDEGFQIIVPYHLGSPQFIIPVKLKNMLSPGLIQLNVTILYQVCNNTLCYPPKEKLTTVTINLEPGEARPDRMEMASVTTVDLNGNIDLDSAIRKGFWSFVILALSMGFLALLTPCVFPMIPITVSYFTHQGEIEGRNPLKQASVYAFGIIATFTILGFLLAIFIGASGANQLASNPWVNLFIGGLFIYFALSLFGMYEIQLPEGLRRFSMKREQKSGNLGTLFMALTFTLTSFTCTVQFVGLLLVAATQGQWFWPLLGMVIFSAAFALPFFFLALFPQFLAKMPKSGGWLNSVKVVMGFLELAAAFKFLSNTDLVWNWGIFSHYTVLTAWTVILLFVGLYLLGKIRLPHDSPIESVGVARMLLSLLFIVGSLYLATGLFGRPIHGLIYSYLPPRVESISGAVVTSRGSIAESHQWYTDIDTGLRESARTGKPVFVDFTGYTCTNCRWMEANIFTEAGVKERFGQFILVQLFTDAGENYREKQQYEIDRFGTVALPFYVILNSENEELARFPGMTRDVDAFINFLEIGIKSKG